jgi:hypothetical protein
MRLLGDERIPLRDRPAELDPDVREWHNWQWLDRSSLHEVLATVLAVPFTSPEEYAVRGSLQEAAGVRVFTGRIGWLRRSERTGQGEPRWYDELRLSVTDSDPQYVMIGVPHGVDSHKP